MRILVINPNTTEAMTQAIAKTAQEFASPGTEVVPLTPLFGADGIDSNFESLLSAVAVMDRVATYDRPFDAVVMAGFGEHGREGLQEITDVPIIDIAEASAHVALLIGRRYSVVTTLDRSIGAIEDRLLTAGLADRCASVRSVGMGTLEFDQNPEAGMAAIVEEARRAVEDDRAEVICLGCGGMAGLDQAITAALGVPVVDPVAAGIRLAEALVGLGLGTSKVCTYAPLEAKTILGWPLSKHLTL
ncbi:aspartate/glutamate racemase family protein [Streptomyces sp. NPDC005548]|uniref:aspartate/glutamate racemase family protein n=1 Tax=Streptomyces sp. NPDC005548 TaxID=3364724 RepID=UPI0036873BC3